MEIVRAADGRRATADHGGVSHCGVAGHVPLQRALCGFRVAVERQLAEYRRSDDRSGACEQSSASKFSHD